MCCKKLRTAFGADSKCFDNLLSAKENGRKFSILLPKGSDEKFCRVTIDGCLIPKDSPQERCDFLFFRCKPTELYFVELKGKDVKKGVSQIKSTIEFVRPKLKFQQEQVTGFVISSRCPLSSAETQVLKSAFRKEKLGKTLEIHSSKWIHRIE